ncbi:MAG: toll/interleukin-1 receptor domain-containing protein [Terriglobales bacterium]
MDEQILLDEALSRLDVYDDPDPGIYDPPPTREMMTLVQYARRARVWESIIAARKDAQWENSPGSEAERQREEPSRGEPEKPKPDLTQMSAEDRTNSALNLLFLLAQAYHKILECAIGTAEWCTALDPELNESYLWVTSNLQSLLKNHEGLRDFPGAFEPAFADLYPSTIRDVEWDDMVAPGAEQFLSSVQRYVLEKGVYPPEEHSPAWILVELFRSSINVAVERAIAYDQRMRAYARKTFGAGQGAKETVKPRPGGIVKTAFISYSWDDDAHCEWVRELATRLRADGVDVSIDRWAAVPGDQLPAFMERAIRENQFVVILCTSRYKHRSDAREGGVGYEGDIMTAEAVTSQNQRKFIPVLRSGEWKQAAPSWLLGKRYIDLSGDPYRERDYEDLVRTLLGIRETAPPLGREMATIAEVNRVQEASAASREVENDDDIRITRVIVEDITQPRNDGAPGSALYSIPFALSRRPSSEWVELFIENWNHPPRRTSMHRPGIAAVSGSTINLSGTTIEEVERYHRDTLQLAVNQTNRQYRERRIAQDQDLARDQALRDSHQTRVENISKKITFD